TEAVVKLAGDSAALSVLRCNQAGGKLPELLVERAQLPRFAVKVREDTHFGTQQLRDDGHGNVVNRSAFVSSQAIKIGLVNGGDENNGDSLKSGMLANHVRQFESIEFGHAHVHEHDGNVCFQQAIERLPARARLDQIFIKLTEHDFIAQEFSRLVIYHE